MGKYFNKVALSSFVAYLTLFTFACIFMISGVAARKSQLIVPWLVVAFLTLLFFLIMSISAMFAIASVKSLIVLFLAGIPLGFGVYFWLTVYSSLFQFRGEETAKMVRSAIRPEGVNNTCGGNGGGRSGSGSDSSSGSGRQADVVTTLSTAETEETEVCSTAQRPSLPISNSSPTFSNAVAVDIDKEEAALRSGIERSALALKSRLEQPLMMLSWYQLLSTRPVNPQSKSPMTSLF